MLDLIKDVVTVNATSTFGVFLLSVGVSSIIGSGHCLAMCGPLAINVSNTWSKNVSYNLGRLIGYLALGAIAGFIGQEIVQFEIPVFRYILLVLMAVAVIWSGWSIATGKPVRMRLPHFLEVIHQRLFKRVINTRALGTVDKSILMGVVTAGLPCGWLYTYVALAIPSGGAVQGMLVLFTFWLGTVPLMLAAPALATKVILPAQSRYPKMTGACVAASGLLVIVFNWMPNVAAAIEATTCH